MSQRTTEDIEFLDIIIPAGTVIPKSDVKIPKRIGTLTKITIGTFINWLLTKQLRPYWNNRGTGVCSGETCREVRKEIKFGSIGEITYGYHHDENHENGLTMSTFHGRGSGLLLRYLDGNMTTQELNGAFSCRFPTESFLEQYKTSGEFSGAHNNKEKVCNPDLSFGGIIGKIKNKLPSDFEFDVDKFATPLAVIIDYCDAENKQTWDSDEAKIKCRWDKVYNRRQGMGKKANFLAKEQIFDIRDEQLNKIATSIVEWSHICTLTQLLANNTKIKSVKKAGFFGFIVMERYINSANLKDNYSLAKRLVNDPTAFDTPTTHLTKNKAQILESVLNLYSLFRAKVKIQEDERVIQTRKILDRELKAMKDRLKVA